MDEFEFLLAKFMLGIGLLLLVLCLCDVVQKVYFWFRSEKIEGEIIGYRFSQTPYFLVCLRSLSGFWPVIEFEKDGVRQILTVKDLDIIFPEQQSVKARIYKDRFVTPDFISFFGAFMFSGFLLLLINDVFPYYKRLVVQGAGIWLGALPWILITLPPLFLFPLLYGRKAFGTFLAPLRTKLKYRTPEAPELREASYLKNLKTKKDIFTRDEAMALYYARSKKDSWIMAIVVLIIILMSYFIGK